MADTCRICGSSKRILGRSLCSAHYHAAWKSGTLDNYPLKKRATLLERLRTKFRPNENGCWEWTGMKRPDGYGLIWLDNRSRRAHRVFYEAHKGKLKRGAVLCHSCDNRSCVNPDHIFVGTRADNIHDCIGKDRNQFGEHHWQAKLTIDQAIAIKADNHSTNTELALRFGVSPNTISRIKSGARWSQALRVASRNPANVGI